MQKIYTPFKSVINIPNTINDNDFINQLKLSKQSEQSDQSEQSKQSEQSEQSKQSEQSEQSEQLNKCNLNDENNINYEDISDDFVNNIKKIVNSKSIMVKNLIKELNDLSLKIVELKIKKNKITKELIENTENTENRVDNTIKSENTTDVVEVVKQTINFNNSYLGLRILANKKR